MEVSQAPGLIPEGRPASYYRRRAAQWLNGAAEFRRFAVAMGGQPYGYASMLSIARERVEMARLNRAAIAKAEGRS